MTDARTESPRPRPGIIKCLIWMAVGGLTGSTELVSFKIQ
jgi:hypothetical protein